MNTRSVAACAVTLALAATAAVMEVNARSPLRVVATIALPDVDGRIDHLAFDAVRQRLYIAALGNDSVEVVDTASGKWLKSLKGFHEPQGIVVVPDQNPSPSRTARVERCSSLMATRSGHSGA